MTTTPKPKAHLNIVAIGLRLLMQIIGWMVLSWLLAQCILFITFAWRGHALNAMMSEQLLRHALQSFLWQTKSLSRLKIMLQFDIRSIHTLQQLAQSIPPLSHWDGILHNHAVRQVAYVFYPSLTDYAHGALAVTQVVLLRITEVFLFMPLMILLGLMGFGNGLVQRALRRRNGGRESSLLYHYAKAAIKPCLFWGSLLYVVLPLSLEPITFMLPCVIASSIAIFLATKTFKKYT